MKPTPEQKALKSIIGAITIDGTTYIDCRGLLVTEKSIKELQAEQLDFSYSEFRYPFTYVVLKNCRLVGIKYEHVITGTYIDCDFSRANLHRSRASTPLRFDRCNFTGTNFSVSQWDLTQFQDCQFMDTNIKRAEWTLLKFTRCNFSNIQVKDAHVAGCSFIEPRQNM